MVLVHVQPVGRDDALRRDAGTDHLGQPVDVKRADPEQLVDPRPHLLGPRLGAEHARLQRQPGVAGQPRLGQRLAEPDRVRRRAGQDLRPKVRDQRHLPRRHPAGDRNHRRAELDRALVDSEPAGEQSVPVGVVHDRAWPGAGRGQRPRAHPGPERDVGARVRDQRRPAAGPARSVHGDDLVARDREQPERVVLPQILLASSSAARPDPQGSHRRRWSRQRLASRPAWRPPAASSRSISPRSRSACRIAQLLRRHRLGLLLEHRRSRVIIKTHREHSCQPSLWRIA